jgi:hypothetical protein
MRHYIILWFLLVLTSSHAQTLDKESFVNQIYKTLVDTSFPYYQLSNDAFKLTKNDIDLSTHLFPDLNLNEIIKNYSVDTLQQFWDTKRLTKAKEVDKDSIGILTGTTLRIYSLNSWSKRRKRKEEQKQIRQQNEQREKMPLYDKRVYFFSRPVFDNKKEYAIISMSYGCGLTCGHGCTYIFRRINEQWTLVFTPSCWSS